MIDKKTEALKLALEALVDARVRPPHKQDSSKYDAAITAIREALAEQPAQHEPIVTKNKSGITLHAGWDDLPVGTKLYTSPPASKPWISITANTILNLMPESIPAEHDGALLEFARAIEEELKEKNHG